MIKINKTKILLKYFFGARGVQFLEKRRENVQILPALRWRFDVWEAIFVVKNDAWQNAYTDSDCPSRICWIVPKKYLLLLDQTILLHLRSSIDRPLNLPQYPGSNNYFSVQILPALRWRFDVWEAIFVVKNDGMSARNSYIT
jgi:hypothetical protein